MISPHEITGVLPDWQSGAVNFADPPSISFTVIPPIELSEQYAIQQTFDAYIQAVESVKGVGASTLADIQRGYSIRVDQDKEADGSIVKCVFTTVRRSHMSSCAESIDFVTNALKHAIQGDRGDE